MYRPVIHLSNRRRVGLLFVLVVAVYGAAIWNGRTDVALTDDADEYLSAAQSYKHWYELAFRSVLTAHGGAYSRARRIYEP